MAVVPLSGTNIRLIKGIPFQSDYKNTRWFDNKPDQTAYFLGKTVVHSMSESNFQRVEGKTFIRCNKSIDELRGINYMMFQNASYNTKWFYAFVTHLEYRQANVTYVHFQLDVFQTWRFEMIMKNSFVVREHAKLWNADGSPVINTVPENLNYGTDYDVVNMYNYHPINDVLFLVIITKSEIETTTEGATSNKINATLNGSPQPLSYYVHPFKLDGTTPKLTLSGAPKSISPILGVLSNLFEQEGSVNNIVSMYVTDYGGFNASYSAGSDTMELSASSFETITVSDDVNTNVTTIKVKKLEFYGEKTASLGGKYEGYKTVTESKLLMYPYTVLVLDDFRGNRIELKNEYINGQAINLRVKGSLGLSNKVTYAVKGYNNGGETDANEKLFSLENALINSTPNDVPVITDYLSAYLQGNRNSIENQKNSAVFNGIMGVLGNGVSSAGNPSPTNIASNVGSAVQGAGNTVLQIQGIEAKQQDIGNIPPQLAKMGSNTAYDYGNGYKGLYVIKKQIKPEYIRMLEDFFHMYGYKTNRVKKPNLHTRKAFNFVQTIDCNIVGDFNNEDMQELKAIYDNGVTLWHVDDIGNYDVDNGVI